MKQNARYKGGSGTGVDLIVPLVDGQQRPVHVDPGQALPETIGEGDFAVAVAPDFVERLLEQSSEWEPVAPPETPAQRKRREQVEQDQAEQDQAASDAAAAAIERVKAEQQARRKESGAS